MKPEAPGGQSQYRCSVTLTARSPSTPTWSRFSKERCCHLTATSMETSCVDTVSATRAGECVVPARAVGPGLGHALCARLRAGGGPEKRRAEGQAQPLPGPVQSTLKSRQTGYHRKDIRTMVTGRAWGQAQEGDGLPLHTFCTICVLKPVCVVPHQTRAPKRRAARAFKAPDTGQAFREKES